MSCECRIMLRKIHLVDRLHSRSRSWIRIIPFPFVFRHFPFVAHKKGVFVFFSKFLSHDKERVLFVSFTTEEATETRKVPRFCQKTEPRSQEEEESKVESEKEGENQGGPGTVGAIEIGAISEAEIQ